MTQNKTLPGAYIVFASVARASATISDRGVAAAPFELSWGPVGVVREIEQGDFIKNSMELFGYSYSADEMLPLREIFQHALKVYCFRLSAAGATTAECTFAKAKYPGARGNDIRVLIELLDESNYLVTTMVGTTKVDEQTVAAWGDLQDNSWVTWIRSKTESEAVAGSYFATEDTEPVTGKTYYTRSGEEGSYEYTAVATPDAQSMATYFEQEYADVTRYFRFAKEAADAEKEYFTPINGSAGEVFQGGDDGEIDGNAHDAFLDEIEPYNFNTLCCPVVGEDATSRAVITQYINFTKRMRDQVGVKFQLVAYQPNADYEGVIGLWNDASHESITVSKAALTYWLTGAECAAPINGSLTNSKYDGELTINVDKKQSALEQHIKLGHLVFHQSNGDIVVLTDINTLVTLRENFGDMFQKNQTIRYADNVANDLAALFVRRYLGIVQNDESGRASWWNECVKYFRESQRLRAITEFEDDIVEVEIGDTKDSVVTLINGLNIVNAMEKLYMTVICR